MLSILMLSKIMQVFDDAVVNGCLFKFTPIFTLPHLALFFSLALC